MRSPACAAAIEARASTAWLRRSFPYAPRPRLHHPRSGGHDVAHGGENRDLTLRALALLWPAHRRKRIAAWFGVALETAKIWLRDGVPAARREKLADAIDAEIPRLEREITELEAIEAELRAGAHVDHVAERMRALASGAVG